MATSSSTNRPTSLDALRTQILADDRRILDLCWSHYRLNGEHLKIRDAYFALAKPEADAAVSRLTGSLIRRGWSSSSPGDNFELTHLGVLVSSDGPRLEKFVEQFLRGIKAAYEENHQLRGIDSDKLKPYIDREGDDLSAEDLRDLGRVLVLGVRLVDTSAVGYQPNGTWHVNIGDNIDDIRRIPDLKAFIQQELVKSFDPDEPTSEIERANRQVRGNRPPFWSDALFGMTQPQESTDEMPALDFMHDPHLREICEGDWSDAQTAMTHGLLKPAVVLCGAVAEGLLLDALEQTDSHLLKDACKAQGVSRALEEMGLDELVRIARALSKIRPPNNYLAHFLREYRNLVHPARQRREKTKVTKDDVSAALIALRILARDISGK